jgi:hypothetical protein
MRPRERLAEVSASSGRNSTPSSLSFAVGFARLEAEANVTTRAAVAAAPTIDPVRRLAFTRETIGEGPRARD